MPVRPLEAYAGYTFQELCVMLNAEYHTLTAWRGDRMERILVEIVFRVRKMKAQSDADELKEKDKKH